MKTSKLRVTGLYAENSLVTGKFPGQMASNTGNVSILWRHHEKIDLGVPLKEGPGDRLNKKDGLTRYGDSHVKDKTAVRPSYL